MIFTKNSVKFTKTFLMCMHFIQGCICRGWRTFTPRVKYLKFRKQLLGSTTIWF